MLVYKYYLYFLILPIIIIEHILNIKWNPFYYRNGILCYRKKIDLHRNDFQFPDLEVINAKFSQMWASPIIFGKLDNNELVYREGMFHTQFVFVSVLHANLKYKVREQQLVLKCFSNLTITYIYIIFLYGFIKIISEPISIEFIIFPIIFGILLLIPIVAGIQQVSRFKRVVEIILESQDIHNYWKFHI